ncbi:unnamed protein product [Durusdinium trenchii]|uniref:Uncharacterized protein n=1 Tax=Durusdinium trenchii TaxID=1381693 RepID=A0ABP0HTN8_9DINO
MLFFLIYGQRVGLLESNTTLVSLLRNGSFLREMDRSGWTGRADWSLKLAMPETALRDEPFASLRQFARCLFRAGAPDSPSGGREDAIPRDGIGWVRADGRQRWLFNAACRFGGKRQRCGLSNGSTESSGKTRNAHVHFCLSSWPRHEIPFVAGLQFVDFPPHMVRVKFPPLFCVLFCRALTCGR